MKIKNANDVKVGDVLVVGGLKMRCDHRSAKEIAFKTPSNNLWFFSPADLDNLIAHGFEVTRKVEPVAVVEAMVTRCGMCATNPQIITVAGWGLSQGQRYRVTVEPID